MTNEEYFKKLKIAAQSFNNNFAFNDEASRFDSLGWWGIVLSKDDMTLPERRIHDEAKAIMDLHDNVKIVIIDPTWEPERLRLFLLQRFGPTTVAPEVGAYQLHVLDHVVWYLIGADVKRHPQDVIDILDDIKGSFEN